MSPLPGLTLDSVTIQRQSLTGDSEGNASGTLADQWVGRASYGNASATDRQIAGERGQQLDAFISGVPLSVDVQPGDLVTVRGQTWIVTDTYDLRIHQRIALRRTSV